MNGDRETEMCARATFERSFWTEYFEYRKKQDIKEKIKELEGQKPKNTDEFELRESSIKTLLGILASMELI